MVGEPAAGPGEGRGELGEGHGAQGRTADVAGVLEGGREVDALGRRLGEGGLGGRVDEHPGGAGAGVPLVLNIRLEAEHGPSWASGAGGGCAAVGRTA